MTRREEVFQSKVFQKLYPAPLKLEKEPSPSAIVDALSTKTHVKRKASQRETATGDAGRKPSAANPGKRVYTVLPPPADHKTDSEKSVTLPELESIKSADDPADRSVHDSNEEPDEDKEEEEPRQRRRKRRKRKPAQHQDSGGAGVSECGPGQGRTPGDEGGENMSKNKKRKLKKKRHKEKLLALGLMPRAAALDFTYRKDEEEEDDETRAFEVSDFLRTTMEIYMSDPSQRSDQRPLLCGTVNKLLSRVAGGCRPSSALEQLHPLKALVQRRRPDELERALVELLGTSPLSSEETTAVVSLFRYWITHILPMRGEEKASPDAPARRGTLADRSENVFPSAETDSGLHPAAADAGLPPRVCEPPS